MKEKSKFVMFILSFVPGLAHLYIGLKDRAIIFFLAFLGATLGTIGLSFAFGGDFMAILVFAWPLIWLVALMDAFSVRNSLETFSNDNLEKDTVMKNKTNKKTLALVLSIVPGAGHMYLGYQNKGLTIMSLFFFMIFFMGWLNISLFLFVLPVIWFYSFFDAFHLAGDKNNNEEKFIIPLSSLKPEWVGWGLIVIGALIVIQKIIYPLIPWRIQRYIQTSIVAAIFIAGGIKLLKKNKNVEELSEKIEEENETCKKEE